jgi:hypothetical protein
MRDRALALLSPASLVWRAGCAADLVTKKNIPPQMGIEASDSRPWSVWLSYIGAKISIRIPLLKFRRINPHRQGIHMSPMYYSVFFKKTLNLFWEKKMYRSSKFLDPVINVASE